MASIRPQLKKLGGWIPSDPFKGPSTFECRLCFEPAKRAACCGEPLCLHCWSHAGRCPRCHAEIKFENQIHMAIKAGENTRNVDSKKPKLVHEGAASGATSNLEEAAIEAEECLSCLEPGFFRDCCGAYYCNDCFFKNDMCPGCQTPCAVRGFDYKIKEPGVAAIGVGWLVTHILTLAFVVLLIICCVDDFSRRTTLFGHPCYKFTERCDMRVCLEVNATGPPRLRDLNDWQLCTQETSEVRARGTMCVFDEELYRRTGKQLGYDLCYGDMPREHDMAQGGLHGPLGNVGKEFDGQGAQFTGGVYVFEDDFEAWNGTFDPKDQVASKEPQRVVDVMKSALWQNSSNAGSSTKCGAFSGGRSLRFSGSGERWAVTLPLDVRHGGFLNFRMRFQPEKGASEDCDVALNGDVELLYTTTSGVTGWTLWRTFIVGKFPDGEFKWLSLELPRDAWSTTTRFKFQQPRFEDRRDHFSIDDMAVWHRFEDGWAQSDSFRQLQAVSRERTKLAQCCHGTVQCDRRMTSAQKREACTAVVPGFVEEFGPDHEYMNPASPLYICIAVMLALCRWLYARAVTAFALYAGKEYTVDPAAPPAKCCRLSVPSSAKIYRLDEGLPGNAASERRFFIHDDPVWRWSFLILTLVPFVCAWVRCAQLADLDLFIVAYRKLHTNGPDDGWLTGGGSHVDDGTGLSGDGRGAGGRGGGFRRFRDDDDEDEHGSDYLFRLDIPMEAFLLAIFLLDLMPTITVARRMIFCGIPSSGAVPIIDVDARPSRSVMTISNREAGFSTCHEVIRLVDLKTQHPMLAEDLRRLGAGAVLGCMPYASLCLLVYLLRLPYLISRGLMPFVGTIAIVKAATGGDFVLRAAFMASYFYSTHTDDRDEIGAAVLEGRVRPMTTYAGSMATVVGLLFLLSIQLSAWKVALFAFLCTSVGSFWGFLCGVARGLPIEPRVVLTSLRAPGFFIRYERHSRFAEAGVGPRWCRHPRRHGCVDIHSRERMLMLSVDDNQGFIELLRGIKQEEVGQR